MQHYTSTQLDIGEKMIYCLWVIFASNDL